MKSGIYDITSIKKIDKDCYRLIIKNDGVSGEYDTDTDSSFAKKIKDGIKRGTARIEHRCGYYTCIRTA